MASLNLVDVKVTLNLATAELSTWLALVVIVVDNIVRANRAASQLITAGPPWATPEATAGVINNFFSRRSGDGDGEGGPQICGLDRQHGAACLLPDLLPGLESITPSVRWPDVIKIKQVLIIQPHNIHLKFQGAAGRGLMTVMEYGKVKKKAISGKFDVFGWKKHFSMPKAFSRNPVSILNIQSRINYETCSSAMKEHTSWNMHFYSHIIFLSLNVTRGGKTFSEVSPLSPFSSESSCVTSSCASVLLRAWKRLVSSFYQEQQNLLPQRHHKSDVNQRCQKKVREQTSQLARQSCRCRS